VVFEPDSVSKELVVTKIHAGVTKEQVCDSTGWDVRFANNLCQTDSPTDQELVALRDLVRRTKEARRKLS
jgi:glutaconate CoA-transferase subunit B